MERGAGATMGAFVGLSPPDIVTVCPAILSKPRGKGPTIRCVYQGSFIDQEEKLEEKNESVQSNEETKRNDKNEAIPLADDDTNRNLQNQKENDLDSNEEEFDDTNRVFEINNVDSVEKVYLILTKILKIQVCGCFELLSVFLCKSSSQQLTFIHVSHTTLSFAFISNPGT